MTTSRIWGNAPAERTITKFGMRGRVVDVIICVKFYRNQLRGFRVVGAEIGGLPLTLTVALTTGQHYRAAVMGILIHAAHFNQMCVHT